MLEIFKERKKCRNLSKQFSAANRIYRQRMKTTNDIVTETHTMDWRKGGTTPSKISDKFFSHTTTVDINKLSAYKVGTIKWIKAPRFSVLWLRWSPKIDIWIENIIIQSNKNDSCNWSKERTYFGVEFRELLQNIHQSFPIKQIQSDNAWSKEKKHNLVCMVENEHKTVPFLHFYFFHAEANGI